jgi:hypothetical protein
VGLSESSSQFYQEVSPVLSKCANPACLARLQYLRKGRIFKIETSTASSESKNSSNRRIEYFWLCERCTQTLTVVLENGVVTTRSLHLQLAKIVSQENPEKDRDVA